MKPGQTRPGGSAGIPGQDSQLSEGCPEDEKKSISDFLNGHMESNSSHSTYRDDKTEQ